MSDSVSAETNQPRIRRKRRWILIVALVLALIFLLWIGLLVRDGLAVRADVLAMQDYAASLPRPVQPADIDLAWLQQRMTLLDDNLAALRNHAGPLLLIAPALGWLPEIGGDVQAAPALLDMAQELAQLGRRATTAIAPLWPPEAMNGRLSLPVLTRWLQVLQPAMTSWPAQIDRVQTARQRIDTAYLSPRVRGLLERYDEAYPLAKTGLMLMQSAPQLLGADRPRTYLLLFQNEDELRATGGFISAAGRVTVDAGKIISLTVEDSYAVDDFTTPYPDPPAPLRDYMGIDLWVFRDSNWSPDFPTAARQAISLYTQTRGGTIDGVIALDQRVVEALVDGLGPLDIDGQTIANAPAMRDYMRRAWAPAGQSSAGEWIVQRKNFIGRVMQLLLDRLLNGGETNWPALGQALNRVLRSRDLAIVLLDAQLNEPLHVTQLDGALRPGIGDYLMVVDTNMGFNKASVAMQQAMQYTVTLAADREPQATLAISYANTNPANGSCSPRPLNYDLTITYDQLVQQCYWVYRRVLTPSGSQLDTASRHPATAEELATGRASDGATRVTAEDGKTVFGTFLVVPRQQGVESLVSYTLPASVVQRDSDQLRYHLVWQKQPGASAWPVRVTVQWTAGWRLRQTQPQPVRAADRSASFEFALDRDQEIDVILGKE
jgi:hypothetical protein